ncbi:MULTISPECIES: hypothetical protein [Burkholderia]|uniref:hypothetical protein n=1 Tax=Burkholderia TaxID=32008 RepID=UPI0011AF8BAE|nr:MULTISPECIES: hypothetical protein [unclassified Burkholderia]
MTPIAEAVCLEAEASQRQKIKGYLIKIRLEKVLSAQSSGIDIGAKSSKKAVRACARQTHPYSTDTICRMEHQSGAW